MDRRSILELMGRLNRDAALLARAFGLEYRSILPERANVKRRYGICYSDGTIKIRLFHATTRRPLKYSSLIDTLCHELAHLRHFNHGKRFQVFYRRILEYARRQGIYQPGPVRTAPLLPAAAPRTLAPPRPAHPAPSPPPRPRGPEQLALF